MTRLFLINLFIFIMITLSCKKSTQPLNEQLKCQIELQQSYSPGVTDGYLKLTVTEADKPAQYKILRDGQPVITGSLDKIDTLLVDTSLTPNTTYTYIAQLMAEGKIVDTSRTITLTTLDTTSHEITWEIFTFGDHSFSELNDVAIIDENNIWAVGKLSTEGTDQWNEDSTEWIPPYNAVHWDGNEWELLRIPYEGYHWKIESLLAFVEESILFEHAVYWDGQSFESLPLPYYQSNANKMWGKSKNNFYIVGNDGLIAHYNGEEWQKLTSGTDLPIQDIWGATDPLTGEEVVLCVASDKHHNNGSKLLKIENNFVTEIPASGLPWSLKGLWFSPGKKHYIVGDGIFLNNNLKSDHWSAIHTGLTTYYTNCIRGNEVNDIYIAGDYGVILHCNGMTWENYHEQTYMPNSILKAVDVKDNLVVAVGLYGIDAVIIKGER